MEKNKLQEALQKHVNGLFYFSPIAKRVYSVDASIFEIEPLGAVLPYSKKDLIETLKIAYEHRIPVTARGAATGITGGCLGKGLVVDLSKINQLGVIDTEKKTATCQPGLIQDDLNNHLKPFDLRLGPDTSTGNRATLGGMLANNAAGSRSLYYGKMVDHVISVEIARADGSLLTLGPLNQQEWDQKISETNLYKEVERIRTQYAQEIRQGFPSIPRRVSGYNLDTLLQNPPNLAKLIAGSEGTLGIVTEMTLSISPRIHPRSLHLFFFDDLLEAFSFVPRLLSFKPSALELIDNQIIQLGRASPAFREGLPCLKGNPQALLIMEIPSEETIHLEGIGYLQKNITDTQSINQIWALRKAGLGILLSKRSYSRAVAFLEDVSVPPEQLFPFMTEFLNFLKAKGKTAGIYGHAGSGCMHIRPYMNLQDPDEIHLMRQMMEETTTLLIQHGGTLSGEHGDGWIRSWLNPRLFGPKLAQAFKEIKQAFDPENLLNPGKIVPLSNDFESLRFKPLVEPKTFLNFEKEGGFALSADLCNGNGLCRKKEKVMCPSFQATNEEFHSTRARAQALRGIVTGREPLESLTSQEMHDVMDLCISCKGCKTECPSQVDMAKMKSEFLYHYQKKHGVSLRSRLFGSIGPLSSWMSPFASWLPSDSQTLKKWLDIAPQRKLPVLAKVKFSKWFQRFKQPAGLTKEVALFNDTFTEFYHPSIGEAAVQVLNRMGYYVHLIPWSCCGRPALSKGLLVQAKKQANKVASNLSSFKERGIPIVGLEPSCVLSIRDDYGSLLLHAVDYVATFDEFLAQQEYLPFQSNKRVLLHGHCYQKALVGMAPTLKVLKTIGLDAEEIPSGCCGMAGSFGFEKEHYDISMKMGGLVLFPSILDSPDLIIASGTSCRQQIQDGTKRPSLHLAEALVDL